MNIPNYLLAMGQRPVMDEVPSNWLTGKPFILDAAIANGSATAVDLTTHDAWYGDAQVRAQYAPANGGSTRMNATLHLEAVALQITDSTFTEYTSAVKEKLWTTAYLSVAATIGGVNFKFPLDMAIEDRMHGQWAAATSSPATTVGVHVPGRRYVLSSPVRVDLYQDSLSLASEADAALGGAISCKVLLFGSLFPNDANISSASPGRSCGSGGGQKAKIDPVAYRGATLGAESLAIK